MLKTLFTCLVLFAAKLASAQYDDLLHDPDITWMAEYTTDMVMNPKDEFLGSWLNVYTLIRLETPLPAQGICDPMADNQQYLSENIFKDYLKGSLQTYADSTLLKPLSAYELQIKAAEPYDFSDYSFPEHPVWVPTDINSFRVRQVFWYDTKLRRFGSRFLAYAPVYSSLEYDDYFLNPLIALYWLPGKDKTPKRQITRPAAYVFQTQLLRNAPGLQDFKVLKGQLDLQRLITAEITHPSYPRLDPETRRPLSTTALQAICYGVDTVQENIYETDRIIYRLEPRDLVARVDKISFVQNWYYDDQKHQLYAELVGWAPLYAVRNEEEQIYLHRRLFYQTYR